MGKYPGLHDYFMNLKKMPFVALFLALLYCAFDPFIVSAKTGSVEGWVVDHSGAVIPDAKIIATFIFTNPFVPKYDGKRIYVFVSRSIS